MFAAEALELHRVALTGHCYRMLGSAADAEDAVQETLLRAWQRRSQYDPGRGSLVNWLYGIATHAAIDLARGRKRRALPTDFEAPADPRQLGRPLPTSSWVTPIPDSRALPHDGDPAELAIMKDSVRLAFVATLQQLPARQRAVLILRDVLSWSAAEVGELLDLSATAVASLLQRARATIGSAERRADREVDHELLDRYVDAFSRHDVEAMVALLQDDVISSMPPFPWWIQGRDRIAAALAATDYCRGSQFVLIEANGSRAYAQYLPDGDELKAWAIVLFETGPDGIASEISYLDTDLFDLFGLPRALAPMNSAVAGRTASE